MQSESERPAAGDSEHGVTTDPTTWPTGRLLSAAARRMEQAWNAYLAQWHLNHASLPALAILAVQPASQRDLATRLGVTEQTTSRIVAGLERNGYVTRQQLPDDRRVRLLAATAAGLDAVRELDEAGAIGSIVEHGLSAAEEARLRELLVRFL